MRNLRFIYTDQNRNSKAMSLSDGFYYKFVLSYLISLSVDTLLTLIHIPLQYFSWNNSWKILAWFNRKEAWCRKLSNINLPLNKLPSSFNLNIISNLCLKLKFFQEPAWKLLTLTLLPPVTKLGQGNIFRSMCQEFCSHPGAVHAGRYGKQVGCMHPTGMHTYLKTTSKTQTEVDCEPTLTIWQFLVKFMQVSKSQDIWLKQQQRVNINFQNESKYLRYVVMGG